MEKIDNIKPVDVSTFGDPNSFAGENPMKNSYKAAGQYLQPIMEEETRFSVIDILQLRDKTFEVLDLVYHAEFKQSADYQKMYL